MSAPEQKNKDETTAQLGAFDPHSGANRRPQEYYDAIKAKFAEERDLRLKLRPEGTAQFKTDFDGGLSRFGEDSYNKEIEEREPINDTVEVLFIGGGFSALLTTSQLREVGVERIRISVTCSLAGRTRNGRKHRRGRISRIRCIYIRNHLYYLESRS